MKHHQNQLVVLGSRMAERRTSMIAGPPYSAEAARPALLAEEIADDRSALQQIEMLGDLEQWARTVEEDERAKLTQQAEARHPSSPRPSVGILNAPGRRVATGPCLDSACT